MWLGVDQTGNGNVKTGNVYSGTANHQPVNTFYQFLLFVFGTFALPKHKFTEAATVKSAAGDRFPSSLNWCCWFHIKQEVLHHS